MKGSVHSGISTRRIERRGRGAPQCMAGARSCGWPIPGRGHDGKPARCAERIAGAGRCSAYSGRAGEMAAWRMLPPNGRVRWLAASGNAWRVGVRHRDRDARRTVGSPFGGGRIGWRRGARGRAQGTCVRRQPAVERDGRACARRNGAAGPSGRSRDRGQCSPGCRKAVLRGMLRVLMGDRDVLAGSHPAWRGYSPSAHEALKTRDVRMHPAAARFFRERGWTELAKRGPLLLLRPKPGR